jgi:hypothetical protein
MNPSIQQELRNRLINAYQYNNYLSGDGDLEELKKMEFRSKAPKKVLHVPIMGGSMYGGACKKCGCGSHEVKYKKQFPREGKRFNMEMEE